MIKNKRIIATPATRWYGGFLRKFPDLCLVFPGGTYTLRFLRIDRVPAVQKISHFLKPLIYWQVNYETISYKEYRKVSTQQARHQRRVNRNV